MPKAKSGKIAKDVASSVGKDIRSARIWRIAGDAFSSWRTSWPWLFLSILLDLVFLISTSMIITLIQFSLFDHLEKLMELAGEATGGLMNIYNQTAEVSAGMMGLAHNPDFQYHLNTIIKYLGLMVLATFLTWIVFQALAWFVSYRMSSDKKRLPFFIFWKNFALQTIPFYALSVLWIFLSVRLLFSIKTSMAPWMGEGLLNFLFIVATLATWYFGVLSYTITGRSAWSNFKQSFSYGTRKFSKVIQSILLITALFILVDLFLRIPFIRQDAFLMVVIGTMTFLPAVCYARILMFRTAQEYWQEKGKGK